MGSTIELDPKKENPRWTLCRAALGREPAGWEFMLWMNERWRNYADFLEAPKTGDGRGTDVFSHLWWTRKIHITEAQQMFDNWLKEQVENGKFKEVP